MNDFFSDKLGLLYTPIDVLVRILTSLKDAERGNYTLDFPGLKWGNTYIIPEKSVTLSSVFLHNKEFAALSSKVRLVINFVMIISVLNLLSKKLKEILEK